MEHNILSLPYLHRWSERNLEHIKRFWEDISDYHSHQIVLVAGAIEYAFPYCSAARRPVDIAVSADYAIFERTAQKIDCEVGCVARSAVLLELYVVYVFLFHSGKEKVFQHAAIADTINGYGGFFLVFKEKRPSHSLWVHWRHAA